MAKQKRGTNPLAAKLLRQVEYEKVLDNSPFEHTFEDIHGNTFAVNQANAKTEARYQTDLANACYAKAFPVMIFLRLLDSRGQRVFTHQKHLDELMENTEMAWIMDVGEKITIFDLEQVSLSQQKDEAKKKSEG